MAVRNCTNTRVFVSHISPHGMLQHKASFTRDTLRPSMDYEAYAQLQLGIEDMTWFVTCVAHMTCGFRVAQVLHWGKRRLELCLLAR